ncbi:MAG: Crp/Fnr family transcriptional regulator [Methylomicrobium sp.]|nr:Crp/Fnr family transcriptional regulator [Methylomicrobium sp.]
MHQELLNTLQKIPFLASVPQESLASLSAHAKTTHFPKDAFIITEGDDTHSMFILLSGKVRVFTSDDEGKEVTLAIQEAGAFFGELALLGDEPRSASVVTTEKCLCGIISKYDFKQWLLQNPEICLALLSTLSDKVRQLTDKVKQLALSNVYERTIRVLKDMAVDEQGIPVIRDRPTQQELANMVGASREMINKIMKELTKGGYVEIDHKSLKIINKLPASW